MSTTRPLSPSRLSPLHVVAAASLLAAGLFVAAVTLPSADAGVSDLAGVHVIHQVTSSAQLTSATPAIRSALAVPGVVAFGVRVPWSLLENATTGAFDPSILVQAKAVVNTPGDSLTVRFMAGSWTPTRVKNLCGSTWLLTSGSTSFPKPFNASGALNTCFLEQYDIFVDRLDTWARANDVHEVHLSHYAKDWAEFYWGPEVQAIAGSGAAGQTAFVNATDALVDIGMAHADGQVAYELPMSGHGPLMSSTPGAGIADRVSAHVVDVVGAESPLFYVQGNGWDTDGIWGAPSQTVEAQMDLAINDPRPLLGVQAINPLAYTQAQWNSAFAEATNHEATYIEIYNGPSWTGTSGTALAAAIAAWTPYTGGGPPPTTTLPPTTTVAPTTTVEPTTTTTGPTGTCQAVWEGSVVESRQSTQAACALA